MTGAAETVENILIVDDEKSVRTTFREWLEHARLRCAIFMAADAESALRIANSHPIDLAILDWNLGAGNDGLRLLEDLSAFNPDIVAIMVTGYAHQATPLHAMRMGVRDYLDKNQDLNRETFVQAIQRQLERIRPAKEGRRLHQVLLAFRQTLEKVLALVQSTEALTDPVPLPAGVRSLIQFVLQTIHARDGVLIARHRDGDVTATTRVYDAQGKLQNVPLVPFERSIAASALSIQAPAIISNLASLASQGVELQPFERQRSSLLAAPVAVSERVQVVLEFFDREDGDGQVSREGFTAEDASVVGAAAEFAQTLLRQRLSERDTHRLLLDAVREALAATEARIPGESAAANDSAPAPASVLDQLRTGLETSSEAGADPGDLLQLAEVIRRIYVRHGTFAVRHCRQLIEDIERLLGDAAGIQ